MIATILDAILLLLAVSVIIVALFRRLNLPPVLGYLCVGVMVGPHGMGWIPDNADTRLLAEFGVVFLLFTVGLEVSLPQMVAMRRDVLGLGGSQVIVTAVCVALLAWLIGLSPEASFVVGGVLALSSTAVVIKQLNEQLELSSRHGRLSLGVLLFQDAAVVPFLILIPALSGHGDNSVVLEIAITLAKGAIVIVTMMALGHWMLRPLFHEIASSRSSELFTLTALLFALAAAWVTHFVGLSLALGAFLAGMLLGETEFRHQVEADIRPFRDVLLGLFFITIGMLFDISVLPGILGWVLLLLVTFVLFKSLLIMGLSMMMGATRGVAMRTGVVLAQGGEFGFALLALAYSQNLLDDRGMQVILAAMILSMALAPLLIRYNGAIAKRLCSESYATNREQIIEGVAGYARDLNDHTIICGFGRIGQNISRFLEQDGFDYIALDLDPVRVREARSAGEQVNYGDTTHAKILEAAGIARARAVVITFDDVHATIKVLNNVRSLRPDIPVLVRTGDDTNLERLQHEGATEVVPDTLEASMMLVSHLLFVLGVSVSNIVRQVQDVRADRYKMLRGFFHGQDAAIHDEQEAYREQLHTVTLPDHAFAVDKPLDSCHLNELGVRVTAVRRNNIRGQEPDDDMILKAGDALILYGKPEDLNRAEKCLLSG